MGTEQVLQWWGLVSTILLAAAGLGIAIARRVGDFRRDEYMRWAQTMERERELYTRDLPRKSLGPNNDQQAAPEPESVDDGPVS